MPTVAADGPSIRERYDNPMQSIEIDPELNRHALAEAAKLCPEFVDQASHVIARPLAQGLAWQLVWKGAPPPGQEAWEFRASGASFQDSRKSRRRPQSPVSLRTK
jgi:hypothetical protein